MGIKPNGKPGVKDGSSNISTGVQPIQRWYSQDGILSGLTGYKFVEICRHGVASSDLKRGKKQ